MEWAVGIPGSVGGAVRMNAGGHGAETSDRLVACRIVSLEGGRRAGRDGDGARAFLPPLVGRCRRRRDRGLVPARAGRRGRSRPTASREIVRWRREHQPGGQNAGSVFTNPPDDAAGRLVEAAGLKGLRIGSAAVSEKHANFIQADPGGSADDVRRVIDEVQAPLS